MPISCLGMGRRRRRVGRPRRRRGGNLLSDIGNALSTAHSFIRRNKIISTVGNALGAVGVPYAGAVGKIAGIAGYGRRRRVRRHRGVGGRRRRTVRRRRGGADLRAILSSAHDFVKKRRLLSGALKHFGHHKLSAAAHAVGYGRRRRVYRRRRGGADLKSILSSAHKFVKDRRLVSSALRHFGHHKFAAASHALGYGRRRYVRRRVRHHGGANFFSTEQIAAPKF